MAEKLVCLAVMAVSLLVLLWLYAKGKEKNKKDAAKVMAVAGLLGLAICVTGSESQKLTEDGKLKRNAAGGDTDTQELLLYADGIAEAFDYTVEVEAQRLMGDELEQLFDNAGKEAEQAFLNSNLSLDRIEYPVSLPKNLQDGQVRAKWEFNPEQVIGSEGELYPEALDKNGTLVMVSLTLSYFEEVRNHTFGCMVYQRKLSGMEQLLSSLQEYFEQEQEISKHKQYMRLPAQLNGMRLKWSKSPERTYQIILLLGLAAAAVVYIQQGMQEQKLEQKRKEQLLRQYPDMVSKISLLLGAGMTLSGAWERIVLNYQRQLERHQTQKTEVYEQMLLAYREMQDGIGELKVYERFGERCGTPQYRKLAMLIIQNLRKGSCGLRQILEKEVSEAFALRKNHAKKAGEEAGTKILIPMMLMLCIVMVIILVPAFLSIQIG